MYFQLAFNKWLAFKYLKLKFGQFQFDIYCLKSILVIGLIN